GAVAASAETPRWRRFALEAEGDERRREELVLALDAEASPELAGTTGVRPQAIAHDVHRRHARFHDLHGIVARGGAREDDHRRLAVIGWTGTRAAGVEVALDEQPGRLRMGAEGDGGHLIAVGAGGDPVRQGVGERAQPELDE